MTAKEIRQFSIQKQYKQIQNMIIGHTDKLTVADYWITYDGKIIPEVKELLEKDGYEIKTDKNNYNRSVVSWSNEYPDEVKSSNNNDIPINSMMMK
jgi:hypothetical protein